MACCYCGYGQPIIQTIYGNEVVMSYINKDNQFSVFKTTPGTNGYNELYNFSINFCPYCGEKLYKGEKNIAVHHTWQDLRESSN